MKDDRPCVLVVDDERVNIDVLVDLIKDDYRVLVAKSGELALRRAVGDPAPDLILLDVMMPEMDGHEVCRRLKAAPETSAIPVIFVTALSDSGNEAHGLALGAVDYLTKPISAAVVKARIKAHLENKMAREYLRDRNKVLENLVVERTREVSITQDVTILAMATLAETRDNETGNHIRRTQAYMRILATHLRNHPRFASTLDDRTIEIIYKSAPLHDIGKVGIPDSILLKPGKLSDDEFTIMKQHTVLGRNAILTAEMALLDSGGAGQTTSFLSTAREIAYGHHEKWDGSGYPENTVGDAIPLSARLMAVADVYDALISRRVYKPPMPHEKAVQIIAEGSGTHFDPDIVTAFLDLAETFRAVAVRFGD